MMHFLRSVAVGFATALSICSVSAASVYMKRQVRSPGSGTIVAPANGTTIQSGSNYDFNFEPFNWCQDGYLSYTVYLLADLDPEFSELNPQGQFTTYLFNYGNFTIAEFGLPPQFGIPPPPTLSMPHLDVPSGEISFAIVTIGTECPGYIPVEYALTYTTITYII